MIIHNFVSAVIRVTKKFNSKDYCVARSYEYLLPTYALSPTFEVSHYIYMYVQLESFVANKKRF